MTLSSVQSAKVCATGKPFWPSAEMTQNSRSTACANGSNLPNGFRRIT
jgi:hypothetical protein